MAHKQTSLTEAIASVADSSIVALGGNTIHRAPCAAVHELVRQHKQHLELVKTAGAYDVDLLVGSGVADRVSAGFIGFENVFGLAPQYRRAAEQGRIQVKEHACYTVITGLRAAVQGVPFLPVAGMLASDLMQARSFKTVQDPYSGEELAAIQAIKPDVAILHVQEADELGNGRIYGSVYEDDLMARAARRVILTCERLISTEETARVPELTTIPGIFVSHVVVVPRGAHPCSCGDLYDYDYDYLEGYINACHDSASYQAWLAEHILSASPQEQFLSRSPQS
ncbi:CoA transferase subunit A [Ktedonosporobacter rubrisoli]|uniref:CoA transferase subunit A n=1 Tax=Ktedonosporobacter rubrisoli TaxID=2509675 RepID=A0A4P6JUT0_KTERU|nr:CoA-transferase [Ktedonosporobacter rubrisoli]QBD79103.1 CoA transferase subunit A [Ktedonosporobacter rubrisoli]